MDNIAVFGGTFNPIHNGHLEIIKALIKLDIFSRILVIPTNVPPHKNAPMLASGEDRLNMCRLAVKGFPCVEVSDIELRRTGPSYSYDTVCELKESTNAKIYLVCGGDMIATLDTWRNYDKLIRETAFVAFRRVGVDNTEFDRAVRKILENGGSVTVIDTEISDVSSTEIRLGDKDFLPLEVKQYIEEKGLYCVND